MKYIIPALLLSATCYAILPPAWEGVREIKAILDDSELANYLESGDAIQAIEKTETGWAIQTNHSKIDVEVTVLPQDMPGPQKFDLKFSK